MSRILWTYKGIAAMGDAHGEILIHTTTVNGRTITRHSHGNGRRVYTVDGQSFRLQREAVAAAQGAR